MNPSDLATFTDAVAMAQAGNKQEAYSKLRPLASNNLDDVNLFLWIAFTSSDPAETKKAILQAIKIDPNNPTVKQAKEWFLKEKAKELPAASPQGYNPTAERVEQSRIEVLDSSVEQYQFNQQQIPPQPMPGYPNTGQYYQTGFQTPPMPSPNTQYYQPQPQVILQPIMQMPQTVGFQCPFCHAHAQPLVKQKISASGWIAVVILFLVCFPICWIGLLIKEDYRQCSQCGIILG